MSLHQSVWWDCEQSGRDTSHIIFHRDNKYLPSTHQAPCETKGGQVDANSLVSVNIGRFTDFFYFFLCEDNISHFFYTTIDISEYVEMVLHCAGQSSLARIFPFNVSCFASVYCA